MATLSRISRFHLRLAASVCLGVPFAAVAQSDPFADMRANHGEQMISQQPSVFQRGLTSVGQSGSSGPFESYRSGSLPLPPLPAALGDDLPYAAYPGWSSFIATDSLREIFYGSFATLLRANRISTPQIERLSDYRGARETLVREIRAKVEELKAAPPALRRAGLAELARQQEGRLQSLEKEAEAIRAEFAGADTPYEFFGAPAALMIGDTRSREQAISLMHALYHFPGLSIEQRQLLPEIAYGIPVLGREGFPVSEGDGGTRLFFQPATSQLRLPASLTPALQAKLRAFVEKKERIKADLRAGVLREDFYFSFHRAERLSTLASAQAPEFSALEDLAEEIRLEFEQSALVPPPESPSLPDDLTQRVGNFTAHKAAVQHELAARLRQMRAQYPQNRFEIVRQGDSLAITPVAAPAKSFQGLAEFNASLVTRYAGLADEAEGLRRDIQRYTSANPNSEAATVDEVATRFAKAYRARQTVSRYKDYSVATLQPGLSPAQRRVLFQSATEQLDEAGWLPRR